MSTEKNSSPVKRRTKGENTRKLILLSTIQILAVNGIKGTTHRAVAAHANIQLSLTTYYFKDIQELVYEAFLLSSKINVDTITPTWNKLFELIESYDKTSLRKVTVKDELCQKITNLSADYLHNKILTDPSQLAIEQLMFSEALFNPKLRPVVESHRNEIIKPCIKFCKYFNKSTADVDADIMLTVFTQLQYRNLSVPQDQLSYDEIKAVTYRMYSLLMRLKP